MIKKQLKTAPRDRGSYHKNEEISRDDNRLRERNETPNIKINVCIICLNVYMYKILLYKNDI